jgi:hypothetical protein
LRLRLVVVAAFAAMTLVPAVFAYTTGVLPGPTQASAGSAAASAGGSRAVATLAWPKDALGLAATDTTVLWEQRDPSAAVAGLWSYDARSGATEKLLGRSSFGKAAGFPSATNDLIVWAAWTGRRGDGPPAIEAYDSASLRRWTVAETGRDPIAAGDSVIWVASDPAGADVIHGSNGLTDEAYSITADGHIRAIAAWGSWAAWISGRGTAGAVWAGSYRDASRYRLAGAGTAVAMDQDHIVWAAAVGRHSSSIVAWDRRSSRATVLCKVVGSVSSISLSRRYVTWVTTRDATGPQVWVCAFSTGKASLVDSSRSRQASPVIVAGTLYWADDRSGHWELYAKSLQG